jgi:hypothetical protein
VDKKKLGEYLREENKITDDQIQRALLIQANNLRGGNAPLLGTVLVQMGAVREQDVSAALEKQNRVGR